MKTPLLLLATVLCIALLYGACKPSHISPSWVGDWRWKVSAGGLSYHVINTPPDSFFILTLKSNNVFVRLRNGVVYDSGQYRINDTVYSNGGFEKIIRFDHNNNIPAHMTVKGDSLTLREFIDDGFIDTYTRQL